MEWRIEPSSLATLLLWPRLHRRTSSYGSSPTPGTPERGRPLPASSKQPCCNGSAGIRARRPGS